MAHAFRQFKQCLRHFLITPLHETWNFGEIKRPIGRKRLQGVQNAGEFRKRPDTIQRNTARSVEHQGSFVRGRPRLPQIRQGIISNREHINLSLWQLLRIIHSKGISTELFSKLLRTFHAAGGYSQNAMACLLQILCKVRC